MPKLTLEDRVLGNIIGSAVGDALGAPCECVHYQRILKEYGDFTGFADLAARNAGWPWQPLGTVTDDTVLADLLLDAILAHGGLLDAHRFAAQWEQFETPIDNPDGKPINRLERVHFIERIIYLRNRFRQINKRELGHGEANATNAVMFIGPVGVLCAGDPNKAAVMAADVTAVNQHGGPRDVAAGYAAALAECFVPNATVDSVIETALAFTGDYQQTREMQAMLALARTCKDCGEFIRRYHTEIIGPVVPFQDLEHAGKMHWMFKDEPISNTWDSAEVLGPTLAMFYITGGKDAAAMMLGCAKIGRDADTICRCAGGLIGTWAGAGAIPAEWRSFVLSKNRWLRLEAKAQALADVIRRRAKATAGNLAAIAG